MVGRLDPQKGFDLLTGAAKRLVAAGGRLIVLGTGDHGARGWAQGAGGGDAGPDRRH